MMFSIIPGFVDTDYNRIFHVIHFESVHTRGHNLQGFSTCGPRTPARFKGSAGDLRKTGRSVALKLNKKVEAGAPWAVGSATRAWNFCGVYSVTKVENLCLRLYMEHCNVNCRLNAFVCRNINVWNRLPAHVVNSDSVAVIKRRLACVNLVNFCSWHLLVLFKVRPLCHACFYFYANKLWWWWWQASTRMVKPVWIYTRQEMMAFRDAVASTGLYANNLPLAPDR